MARVVFFAFDIAEAAQLRRIDSLRALGHGSPRSRSGATTWRRAGPDWPNLALGPSSNNRYSCGCCGLGGRRGGSGGGRDILGRATSGSRATSTWCCSRSDARGVSGQRRPAGLRMPRHPRPVHACGRDRRRHALGRAADAGALRSADPVVAGVPGRLFPPGAGDVRRPSRCWRTSSGSGDPLPRPAPRERRTPMRPSSWAGSDRCAAPAASRSWPRPRARWGPSVEIVCHGAVHRHALPGFDDGPGSPSQHPPRRAYRYPDALARSTPAAMRSGRRTSGRRGQQRLAAAQPDLRGELFRLSVHRVAGRDRAAHGGGRAGLHGAGGRRRRRWWS
jgi:hypothetical protein